MNADKKQYDKEIHMKFVLELWPDLPANTTPAELVRYAITSATENESLVWDVTDDNGVVIASNVFAAMGPGLPSSLTPVPAGTVLHEKCAHCHLFIERNDSEGPGIAEYVHLTRGDEADERYEDHEARPSGMFATLSTWRVYGPDLMRQRFVNDTED